MPKSIYYITDAEDQEKSEEATSANAMAGLHGVEAQPFCTTSTNMIGLESRNITKAPAIIPNEIILLAHTDDKRPPKTIGERTPRELADDFAKMFSNKKDRQKVTDIYLISCEAGMGTLSLAQQFAAGMGTLSLAQQFAAAMVNKGFTNIKIHAVAHPVGALIGGGIEVTTRTGTLEGGKVGQVTGYYYATQESKDYHDYKAIGVIRESNRTDEQKQLFTQLDSRFKSLTKEEKETLRANKINLVTDVDDMNKSYNTFTAKGPESIISADMAITLSFLKRRKNSLLNLGKTDVADAIDNLTRQLKQEPSMTHQEIIAQFEHSLTPSQNLSFFARTVRTVGLDPVTTHIQGYANELNQQLNAINHTDYELESTEETPLLGDSSGPQNIAGQLREYANQRRDEPWGFSWDVLYLKTFSFWLSDCVTSLAEHIGIIEHGTDYLNIKHRETKVSAANKLADIIEGNNSTTVNDLTPAEMGALREGRLHAIASQVDGGLDSYLRSEPITSPMHKKNN